MGRELTRRHSGLFEKRIPNPFQFVYDVYAYGKLSELFSFMVWEVQHKLGLFTRELPTLLGTMLRTLLSTKHPVLFPSLPTELQICTQGGDMLVW